MSVSPSKAMSQKCSPKDAGDGAVVERELRQQLRRISLDFLDVPLLGDEPIRLLSEETGGLERVPPANAGVLRVGEPLILSAIVTDDGVPEAPSVEDLEELDPITEDGGLDLEKAMRKPSYGTVNKVNALHHSWFVYPQPAGAGVTFDPPQIAVWEDVRPWANSPWAEYWVPPDVPEDDRWVARVIFDTPGRYVLRGRADDGGLWSDVQVVVNVEASEAAGQHR